MRLNESTDSKICLIKIPTMYAVLTFVVITHILTFATRRSAHYWLVPLIHCVKLLIVNSFLFQEGSYGALCNGKSRRKYEEKVGCRGGKHAVFTISVFNSGKLFVRTENKLEMYSRDLSIKVLYYRVPYHKLDLMMVSYRGHNTFTQIQSTI